ncbi:MAG: lysoplasmalogenase [Flavobacteriaceae bacterium]
MGVKKNWVYGLLLCSFILLILGITTSSFVFKSGTAGIGIIIICILNFRMAKLAKDTWMIITAFLFSILGDWFLSNTNGDSLMFAKGVALYFVAHIGYLVFALMNGQIKWKFTLLLLGVYLTFFCLMLYPTFTDQRLMLASLIYLLISCVSLGASIGIKGGYFVKWMYVFGIFLILFSDTIIALKEFLEYDKFNFLISPTYYFAHICITYSLIRKTEKALVIPNNLSSTS